MDTDNHIFEPDIVGTMELFDKTPSVLAPERALMLAVLEEATRCFLNHCTATGRKQQVLYQEARDWFRSEDFAQLYDFENVCHVLGFAPSTLRRRLFAARDDRRAATKGSADTAGTDQPEGERRAAG